jgi:uncharacterized protein (TIGR03437 family)
MKRLLFVTLCLIVPAVVPAMAQVWDFSGNGKLNGNYYFREVAYLPDAAGNLTDALMAYGTVAFDGNGAYTINGNFVSARGVNGPITNLRGTYSMGANNFGFFSHPLAPTGTLHGLVGANGTLLASATDSAINDMFIAVPVSAATNATMNGAYTLDYLSVGTTQRTTYGSSGVMTANGNGSIGTVNVRTYLGGPAVAPVIQSEPGVTYLFTNGVGTLRFPTTAQLAIQNNKLFYISPDGDFIFGGSTTGFDMFVGVRRGGSAALSGLYYQLGINHVLDGTATSMDTFYGAFTAGQTVKLEHQRFLVSSNVTALNYTGASTIPTAGTDYVDSATAIDYTISQDGSYAIGLGQAPFLGLRVQVRGPSFNSAPNSAPYIFPTGIVNAASFAAFTKGVAPGELLSIYGANLSDATSVTRGGTVFPTTLNKVRVLMNNRPAAIYFVSPGQIAAIVPYGTTEPIVQIQVERDGVMSNAVTQLRTVSGPGVFSLGQSGQGLAAALHADYTLVNDSNPARRGESLQLFLTGLGGVFPSIPDGSLGGATESSLNRTQPGTVQVRVDNLNATVQYSGLAPGLAGLYQVNFVVPANASLGQDFVDIATPDMITSQVKIPVAAAASAQGLDDERGSSKRTPARRR